MNDAAPERWAAIRLAYEAKEVPVAKICDEFGVIKWDLYKVAHKQGWTLRTATRKRPGKKPKPGAARRDLIAQLYDSLMRQMQESEQHMNEASSEAARERQARTLSSLTRTLEKLVELEKGLDAADDGKRKKAGEKRAAEALREELAQKLLRLTGRGRAAGADKGPKRKRS